MQPTLFDLPLPEEESLQATQLVEEEQPQYKAQTLGFGSLTTAELLCLIIGTATADYINNARTLLSTVSHNLNELSKLSISQLSTFKGISKGKALSIAAAFELSKRNAMGAALVKPRMANSRDIAEFLKAKIGNEQVEVFVVMFLNRSNKVNHVQTISSGGLTGTVADPRVILQLALEHRATSIILSHNHPSGNLQPSQADEEITKKIKLAATYFDIRVIDHIIVSEDGYFSFADEGVL